MREDRPLRGWSRWKAAHVSVERNARNRMDGLAMLKTLDDRCASLVIFDPQYRGVLNKLSFGNEGARQKARAELPQMSDVMIARFVLEIARVLNSSGHLLMWTDKHAVGTGAHLRHLDPAPVLAVVDVLCWNTKRFGMGRRLRSCAEYLIVAQKGPTRAKGVWTDRGIRDVWDEASDRKRHPHAKPRVLIERLIQATTKRGDLVVDPCAGGYGVMDACRASGREFIGSDLI